MYTASTGGSAVWTEAQLVQTRNGVFNAIMGKIVALPASFNLSYWLSLQVGADPELAPRLEMTSVCYSLQTAISDSTRKVGDGSIGSAQLGAGAVTNVKLADASVTGAKIAAGTITGSNVASNTLTAANISDEPGLASRAGSFTYLSAGNMIYAIDSVSITTPAAGYLFLIATGDCQLRHVSGEYTLVEFSINSVTNTMVQTVPAYAQSPLPSGPYLSSFAASRNVYVSGAGTYKYYLLANYYAGTDASTSILNQELTAIYLPTARGLVSIMNPGEPPPPQGRISGDGTLNLNR
jgi:hypothetical protein